MTKEALKLALEALDAYDYGAVRIIIHEALAQPVQPVAARPCRSCDGTGERYTGIDEAPTSICKPCAGTGQIALAQPQRPWVGLTDDEVYRIAFELEGEHWKKIADAIEAKLKQKNT